MIYSFGPDALMKVAEQHWRDYLPAKVRALEAQGQLQQALSAAVHLTLEEMADLRLVGYSQAEAWEVACQHHLILPEEPEENPEPMPDTPAFEAMAEVNALVREVGQIEMQDK